MKIFLAGLGITGIAIAKHLVGKGHTVHAVASEAPSINTPDGAKLDLLLSSTYDLGLVNFNRDVEWSNEMLSVGYDEWMRDVGDQFKAGTVQATRINQFLPLVDEQKSAKTPFLSVLTEEPAWSKIVKNYKRDGDYVSYDSLSVSPLETNRRRLEDISNSGRFRIERRKLSGPEKRSIALKEGVSGYDCTIVAMGNGIESVNPSMIVSSVYEVFVQTNILGIDSYVNEQRSLFVASRPGGAVLNGFITKDEASELGVETFPSVFEFPARGGKEKFNSSPYGIVKAAEGLVEDINAWLGLNIDVCDATNLVINRRPYIDEKPVTKREGKVIYVVGSGRKAAKISNQLAKLAEEKVEELMVPALA